VKAVPEEEVKLRPTGIVFVKQVSFKPGIREGVMDVQSGESEEEKLMGEGIGESEMEEPVPE